MDNFTKAYIEAMFFTESGDENLKDTNINDISPELMKRIEQNCASFQATTWDLISHDVERAGHDFWLTRNGHGAGFWDGDWPESGDVLTGISKGFGPMEVYLGDDGKIYA